MEDEEDGRRRVWCPCPLPRERMEDTPPRHRRHCHWSSVTTQHSPQYRDDDDPVSAVFCCILILFANQTLLPDMSCTTCLWSSLKPLHRPLSCYKSQVMLQCCRSASVVFSACSTGNYIDQEFIFSHSTRINWPSILERNTKIRIPHIPASLNLIYLWPNGIRAEM